MRAMKIFFSILSFLILILLAGEIVGGVEFRIADPAEVKDPDFDIVSAGAYESHASQYFWMQVRGKIDLTPSNYTKNYEVNVTFSDGRYIHFYVLIWEGKKEVLSFAKLPDGWDYLFDNYTISEGNITFWTSESYLARYGNITRVEFIAGEENLNTGHVKSLDFAYYPPHENPETGGKEKWGTFFSLSLLACGGAVAAIALYLYRWRRKGKNT